MRKNCTNYLVFTNSVIITKTTDYVFIPKYCFAKKIYSPSTKLKYECQIAS